MILIVGASAAGKSSIEKELVKKGYKNIVSYTSRPIRETETNHKDYHFITKDEFETKKKEGFFAENTIYNGWYYGIAKSDMKGDAIAVVEPYGFRQIKKLSEKNKGTLISFFIDCPERIRLKRMIDRGDNLMEAFRRIFSDQGVFQGMQDEVTYIIDNNRPINQSVEEIIGYLS
jgi:guanylate kinase